MLKNNKGITLIEVLSGLALISMISLLAFSIHLFSQRQLTNQSNEVETQRDIRIAINIIKKDIRSADRVEVQDGKLKIIWENEGIETIYMKDEKAETLKKDDQVLLSNIADFQLAQEEEKIYLQIESKPLTNDKTVSMKTTLYIRK
jgi:type II secretory pathway component PulJ